MGKSIPAEIINQIPILYNELKCKKKVAEELGISIASVNKYLKLFEIGNIEATRRARTQVTEELINEINRLYAESKNMSAVARELNISVSVVKKNLTEENLSLKDKINDDRDALFFYILRLFGKFSDEHPVNPWNIIQMQKFKSQGISYKAQLLTLKYFYEVKHNSIDKSNNSIGIIPYILTDSEMYYQNEVRRAQEINDGIKRQLEKDRIELKINPSDYIGKKKKKKPIDLTTIGG